MYRTFADVVTKSDLEEQAKDAGLRPFTPPVLGGKPYNDVIDRSPSQALYMEDIITRMEHLPRDTRIDNPLKITNDARKAGLDYRLIDPDSPDFENTKINACVNRIYDIWQKSSEDKGTQLCFCDLSTPKVNSQAILVQETSTIDDEFTDKDDQQEEEYVSPVDMDSIIANMSSNGKFSVYEDIKEKLIKKGVPQREIAFIHDANTDLQKAQLFSEVNNGNIRVLLGSTSKMGAGMNVQQRLVAAHHLDAPWRPSDLEQRNGRIIRQGNQLYEKDPDNFQVGIYYYATKQTYDARMWQTIERKASAIEQFRKGDVLQRTIEDVQSEAANAAEMKAAASGNPLILMEVSLKAERSKLEALSSQYNRGKHRLSDRLKYLSGTEERYQSACVQYTENIKNRDDHTKYIKDKYKEKIKFEVFANNKIMTGENAKELQELIKNCVHKVTRDTREEAFLCRYRGFEVSMKYARVGESAGFLFALSSHGREYQPLNLTYKLDDAFSLTGLFQRMDNFLEKGFDEKLEKDKLTYEREKNERPNVEIALNKGFAQQAELDLVRVNHESVVRELQRMQTEPGYVSEWQPKTLGNDLASVGEQTASEKAVIDVIPAEPKTSLSSTNTVEANNAQTSVTEEKTSKMKLS